MKKINRLLSNRRFAGILIAIFVSQDIKPEEESAKYAFIYLFCSLLIVLNFVFGGLVVYMMKVFGDGGKEDRATRSQTIIRRMKKMFITAFVTSFICIMIVIVGLVIDFDEDPTSMNSYNLFIYISLFAAQIAAIYIMSENMKRKLGLETSSSTTFSVNVSTSNVAL